MKTVQYIVLGIACAFGTLNTYAQNKPVLSETGPQGALLHTESHPVDFDSTRTTHNFVREWTPQKKITNSGQISESSPSTEVSQQTSYVDGLGRHLQTNQRFGASQQNNLILMNDVRRMGTKQIQYLPYSIHQGGTDANKFQPHVFTDQQAFYNTHFTDEEDNAYSRSEYISWSGGRKTRSYAPGKSFTGQDRGSEAYSVLNKDVDSIRKWALNGNNIPVTTSEYAPGELLVSIQEGQHDAKSFSYTDRYGKLICTKVNSGTTAAPTQKITYYIYDEMDRLVYTLSPKAVEKIEANNWLITNNASDHFVLDHLCSRVDYDALGRVSQKHIAGQTGDEVVIYDRWHRPVMTQDPNLKDKGQWLITIYDKQGRAMMTGLLSSSRDAAYWQYVLDGTGAVPTGGLPSATADTSFAEVYTYLKNTFNPLQGDHGGLYPDSIHQVEILSYNYYDHYNYTALSGLSFVPAELSHLHQDGYTNTYGDYPAVSGLTHGMLTGTKVRIIKPSPYNGSLSDWVTSAIHYDKDGRIIQSSQRMDKINHTASTPNYYKDVSTVMYDFRGRVLRSILAHNNYAHNGSVASNKTHRICERYRYESNTFKLLKVEHKIDTQAWQPLSVLIYNNVTGALKQKSLGLVEDQFYDFDINGQLLGINKNYAETSVKNGAMTFGQSLKRNFGFTEKRFDGSISGNIWITPSHKSRAYGYAYDKSGQLLQADFNERHGSNPALTTDWYINTGNYGADFSVSNISYDGNGNLLTLDRKGPDTTGAGTDMDLLRYTYANNGVSNALDGVEDLATAFNVAGIPDFRDHNTGQDYSYDKNNNLITDANKSISNAIQYTYLDKPQKVDIDSTLIEYTYTAGGGKLEELTYEPSDSSWTKKLYEGSFIYKNDTLQLIGHSEGRLRSVDSVFEYDFFVRDHLGNVRTIVTAEEVPFVDYLATHEVAYAPTEESIFDILEEVRGGRPAPGPTNGMAAELDGDVPAKRVGTSLLLHVMAGDKVSISADAYYSSSETPTGTVSAENMLSTVLTSLLSEASTTSPGEGIPSEADIVNGTFSSTNFNAYNDLVNNMTSSSHIGAYINYMVFDENMHLVPAQCGAIQVNTADSWHTLQTTSDIKMQQGGYLAVFVSNKSTGVTAWFDDIDIKFYRGKLLEENHYYPYGMVLNQSHSTTVKPQNTFLYQTKELNKTKHLYWNDFHARQYDAQLGRFTTLDPMGQDHSGFMGMGNNPVSNVDPDGMQWVAVTKLVPHAELMGDAENDGLYWGIGWHYEFSGYWDMSESSGTTDPEGNPLGFGGGGGGGNRNKRNADQIGFQLSFELSPFSKSQRNERKAWYKAYARNHTAYGRRGARPTTEFGTSFALTGDGDKDKKGVKKSEIPIVQPRGGHVLEGLDNLVVNLFEWGGSLFKDNMSEEHAEHAVTTLDLAAIVLTKGKKKPSASTISKTQNLIRRLKGVNPRAIKLIPLTKSIFGHTFVKHGESSTFFLVNRAMSTGKHQGQFLNNQKAAQFILDNVKKTSHGAVDIPIPNSFPARVITPGGTFKNATHIRLVPGGKGVKTAYPLIK